MCRLLIAVLAAATLLSFASSTHAQEEPTPAPTAPPLPGDVDCDGAVTQRDSTLILWRDTGLSDSLACADRGDVNDDGVIDPVDAALILQLVVNPFGAVQPTLPEPLPPRASGEVAVSSSEDVSSRQHAVSVRALNVTAPGLGAWTIDVEYDPSIVSIVTCTSNRRGVCNADFASGIVRLSGAWPGALEGDTELASLTFQCLGVEGVSDLTLNPRIFADATVGGPQPFVPTVTNGSITCGPPPVPTPRPGNSRLNLTFIHDLNADGVFDPGEPGLEGWSVDVFPTCSDMILTFEATNAAGRTSGEVFGQRACVNVRQVGWVLTSGSTLVNVEPGTTVEAIFLFRKVGQEYFRLTGELIVNGLPASTNATLDALVQGQSCGDAQIRVGTVRTNYTLYVLGDTDRSGCAHEGQAFTVTIDGQIVHQASFTSDPLINSELVDLVLGPTPMWFNGSGRDGVSPVPYVGSVVCGEARPQGGGFLPLDAHKIFVFPDALRSGCGAPGRIVTLRVGDEVLRNVVWQEGFVPANELRDIELPVVGASARQGGSGFSLTVGSARIYAISLAMAGLSMLFAGAAIWRRSRAG